jgi:hypothetical protein
MRLRRKTGHQYRHRQAGCLQFLLAYINLIKAPDALPGQ